MTGGDVEDPWAEPDPEPEPARRDSTRAAEVEGPGAWVVLLGCVVAGALVAVVIFGWQAWRSDDDEAAPVPATGEVATTAATDDSLAPGANQLFRRTTDDGIEVRARLMNGFGGVFADGANATVVMEAEGGGVIVRSEVAAAPSPDSIAATTPANGSGPGTSVVDGTDGPVDPGDTNDNGLPDYCEIVGDLTAWAIGDDAVVQGSAPWTLGVTPELEPSLMWDGQVGADSIIGVAMQVGPDVQSARLTGPGGQFDEMEPVEGAVVLAVAVSAEVAADLFNGRPGAAGGQLQVTAVRADGTTMRTAVDPMMGGHPAWGGEECMAGGMEPMPEPMPAAQLPAPGAEQPVDADTDRAAIDANFKALYGRNESAADRSQLIDDNYGLDLVMEQVDANGFGDDAAGSEVEIDELVFTSPTEAAFSYRLTTPLAEFAGQLGRARLIDGIWKITRATLCQDLAKAGATCPP